MRHEALLYSILAASSFSWVGVGQANLQSTPPKSPTEARQSFELKDGFEVEIVASEPAIADPVDLSFAPDGSLYVAEMRGYSENRQSAAGRITHLLDRDQDGHYEDAVVFADGLKWPTAIFATPKGVFVGATPDILFLQDLDGDRRADQQRVIFTGFGSDQKRLNVQTLLNSFRWGPDLRIHGANGGSGGTIQSVTNPDAAPIPLNRFDFSFTIEGDDFRLENGGGQNGLSFNAGGDKFVTQNSRHLLWVHRPRRYESAAAQGLLSPPTVSIPIDGDAAPVFRLSPNEPWRVIRTQWRVAGDVPGPVEGGGRPSGYFTGATGVCLFRGTDWPAEFQNNAFIADAGSNLIHRKQITSVDDRLVAARASGETASEFLASTDNWFRPVQVRNGPDGNLYIVDMYREIIEHPWSLPAPLKNKLDLNKGNQRGRIWRVKPCTKENPHPRPSLVSERPYEWGAMMNTANPWIRAAAQQKFLSRPLTTRLESIKRLALQSPYPGARVDALRLLTATSTLDQETLSAALSDPEASIIIAALQALEANPSFLSSASINKAIRHLASNSDIPTSVQLARTLSILDDSGKGTAALEILATHNETPPRLSEAILLMVQEAPIRFLERLLGQSDTPLRSLPSSFITQLYQVVAEREPLSRFRDTYPSLPLKQRLAAWTGIAKALKNKPAWKTFIRDIPEAEFNPSERSQDEEEAWILFLAHLPTAESVSYLVETLNDASSPEVRRLAVESLARQSHPTAQKALTELVQTKAPFSSIAISALVRSSSGGQALLALIEAEQIPPSTLLPHHRDRLFNHSSSTIREKARRVLASRSSAAKVRTSDILERVGEAQVGQRHFQARCQVCHETRSGGPQSLAPDLRSVKGQGRALILEHILNPNAEVQNRYQLVRLDLANGETVEGIITRESEATLTMARSQNDQTTIEKAQIQSTQRLRRSLMPVGLLEGLDAQEIADLLAYLESL